MLSRELRQFAENPDRYTLLSPDVERFADERVCIVQAPTWAGVSGVRVAAAEVEALVAEVRERIPRGTHEVWWLGPATEPADLAERLLALGLREPEDRPGSCTRSRARRRLPPDRPTSRFGGSRRSRSTACRTT